MIKTNLQLPFDFCQHCPNFSIETCHMTNTLCMHHITISCEHEPVCKKLYDYIKLQKVKNNE